MSVLCCLCSGETTDETLNLYKMQTYSSKTPLLTFIQKITDQKHKLNITGNVICKKCCQLLNELDVVQLRAKEIEDTFRGYLQKNAKTKIQKKKPKEVCLICRKEIENYKAHLKTHIETNSINEKSLDTNSDSFTYNFTLNKQKKIKKIEKDKLVEPKCANQEESEPFVCSKCSKSYRSLQDLNTHLLVHSNEKRYICEICGQGYKRQGALTVHLGMHKGINPFTCVHCSKTFTQKGALMRHLPIHTGEHPYQCDLCGKRFVHHSSFKVHQLSHTGVKSFKCDLCSQALISRSHLRRHMKVHTGEKQYSCSVCDKKFAERYNLVVHEKLHKGVSITKKSSNAREKLSSHLIQANQEVGSLFNIIEEK